MAIHTVFTNDHASAPKNESGESNPIFSRPILNHKGEAIRAVMWLDINDLWSVGLLHEKWNGDFLQRSPDASHLYMLDRFDDVGDARLLFNNPVQGGAFFSNLKDAIAGKKPINTDDQPLPFEPPKYGSQKPVFQVFPGGKGCVHQ